MILPNAPRDPSRTRRNDRHFSYHDTPRGKTWHAYKAGEALWVHVHGSIKSKPCAAFLTDGALGCPYCAAKVPTIVKGYLPLYREIDYKPCCTVLWEDYRPQVDAIPLHARVLIGRELQQTDPIYCMRALSPNPAFAPSSAEQMTPVDVSRSCLRFWKDRELQQWFKLGDGDQVAPVAENEAIASPEERNRAFMNRLQSSVGAAPPSKNGHAKRKRD